MKNKIDSRPSDNRDDSIALLVVSCDAYKDLWKIFFHCLFKYWPDCPYPIYLGSNEAVYSDPRVKSILVGPDRDYSSNLLAMLKHINATWVLLWIEDFVLAAPVDYARLSKMITSVQSQGAVYLKPIASFPYAYLKNTNEEIGILPKGIRYRVNIGITLFKKETLVSLLKPGESAWEIEYNGASRSENIQEDFYCLSANMKSNPPISYINLVGKGMLLRDSIKFLKKEHLEDFIPNRKVQPLRSDIYYKLYLFRLDVYRLLRLYWYK